MKNARIVLFFIVVFASTLTSQVLIRYQVNERNALFEQVNMAGRQRMLSQAMVKNAYELELTLWEIDSAVDRVQGRLQELIGEFEKAHATLEGSQHGDEEIMAAFVPLNEAIRPMLHAARAIASARDSASVVLPTAALAQAQPHFLEHMEATVLAYENLGNAMLNKVTRWGVVASIITFVVLVLAFYFVVRPMLSSLEENQRSLSSQRNQYQSTEARAQGMAAQLDQLNEALERSWEQTKEFVNNAPGAMALVDTKLRYLAASATWYVDYDLVGQSILGREHTEVVAGIPAHWKAIYDHCLKGNHNRMHNMLYAKPNGAEERIAWDIRPWYDQWGKVGGLTIMTLVQETSALEGTSV